MHQLDETLLVPEGQAGVCYSRNNKSETVEKELQTLKYCNEVKFCCNERKVVVKTADRATESLGFCLVM